MWCVTEKNPPAIINERTGAVAFDFAAAELKRYLEKALARPLPENAPDAARVVLRQIRDDALTDEGYEIAATERDVVISAVGGAGAVYGAYEFLRRHVGCRFSGLGAENEFVPERAEIVIAPGTSRRKPRLWYRGMQFSRKDDWELTLGRIDWMAKNGLNYVMVLPSWGRAAATAAPVIDPETGLAIPLDARETAIDMPYFREKMLPELRKRGLKADVNHHNLFFWLPPWKYFNERPEWYALIDGKRTVRAAQLAICSSNAEAMAELTKNVLAFLRDNPEVSIVGVIPEDGYGVCECENCRKLDRPGESLAARTEYRTPEGENRAKIRRYALMVNQVARAVKAEFPDKRVGMAAYVDMAWPPRDVQLEDNVVPWVATYWRCAAHPWGADTACPTNRFFRDLLRQWRAAHQGKLIEYAYYMGMNAQKALPYPMGQTVLGDWDDMEKLGLDGATIQSLDGNFHAHGLNYACFARRAWAADVDYDAVLTEYLEGLFGAAGPSLKPIWQALDTALRRVVEVGEKAAGYVTFYKDKYVRPDAFNIIYYWKSVRPLLFDCLDHARAACRTGREKRQVETFARVARYWEMAEPFFRKFFVVASLEENNLHDDAEKFYPELIAAAGEIADYLDKNVVGSGWVAASDSAQYRRIVSQYSDKLKRRA